MPAVEVRHRPLEISQIQLTQQELLGEDCDLEDFKTQMNSKLAVNLSESIVSAEVMRTIDGASTLKVGIEDPNLRFLKSGRLSAKNLDVKINGLWWRYVRLEKQGRTINLEFEQREVAVLRSYDKKLGPIDRTKTTRAKFILRMIKEVKEFTIDYYIPELMDMQPIFDGQNVVQFPGQRLPGVVTGTRVTVKHHAPTTVQMDTAGQIYSAWQTVIPDNFKTKRKLLVCAYMVAIQESNMGVNTIGPGGHVGTFQQSREQGWAATGNTFIDAKDFFEHARGVEEAHPEFDYTTLCEAVQRSGQGSLYAAWRTEGERWANSYGISQMDPKQANNQKKYDESGVKTSVGNYHYWRGEPPNKKHTGWKLESSWDCIQRLADEVGFRAFFIGNTFYYMSETELFKSAPRAEWNEDSDGIDDISGDYDVNKPTAALNVSLRMGRYDVPPGCVVWITDSGPFDGKWLVETVTRDMFTPHGTIDLKKPRSILAEPYKDDISGANDTQGGQDASKDTGHDPLPSGSTMIIAEAIFQHYKLGHITFMTNSQYTELQKAVAGQPWTDPCSGKSIQPGHKMMQDILWLLDSGWMLKVNCWAAGHPCSNPSSRHLTGDAVDIGAIGKPGEGWERIDTPSDRAHKWIIEILDDMSQHLNPDQIICNGNGGAYPPGDQSIIVHNWNSGPVTKNWGVDDHTDHIHLGE